MRRGYCPTATRYRCQNTQVSAPRNLNIYNGRQRRKKQWGEKCAHVPWCLQRRRLAGKQESLQLCLERRSGLEKLGAARNAAESGCAPQQCYPHLHLLSLSSLEWCLGPSLCHMQVMRKALTCKPHVLGHVWMDFPEKGVVP